MPCGFLRRIKSDKLKTVLARRVGYWGGGLFMFSKKEIEKAINSYNQQGMYIGAGSTGKVYKGILPSGQIVAVKCFINKNAFISELELLHRISHPNLISVIGACFEDEEYYIVYEYCANGNLGQHLQGNESILSWGKRVAILRGIALGLRFLHGYPDGCIIHRNIKPTNILLNDEMEPKLSDFGLAKMLGMEESGVFTDVRGSIGYINPEYMTSARLTCASDVYGFGLVALQILTGGTATELDISAPEELTRKAEEVATAKLSLSDFADPRLNGNFNLDEFKSILYVAVLCTAKSSKGRPVIQMVFNEIDRVWKNMVGNTGKVG